MSKHDIPVCLRPGPTQTQKLVDPMDKTPKAKQHSVAVQCSEECSDLHVGEIKHKHMAQHRRANSHLSVGDLNRSRDGVGRGLTAVSPDTPADNDTRLFFFSHSCDDAYN